MNEESSTGRVVKAERESAGMTQVELSKKTGIPRPRLSLFENGFTALSKKELAAIERAIAAEKKRLLKRGMAVASRKTLRESIGISQRKLAVLSGLTHARVRAWEAKGDEALTEDERKRVSAVIASFKGQKEEAVQAAKTEVLSLDEAENMTPGQVLERLSLELSYSPLANFEILLGIQKSPEERAAEFMSRIKADARYRVALHQAAGKAAWDNWKAAEKQRDELRDKLNAANEELLETYRRITELESELAKLKGGK